jgi:DNA gyrase subunit B
MNAVPKMRPQTALGSKANDYIWRNAAMSQETTLHIPGEVYSGMTFDSFRDGVRKRPAMYIGDVRRRGLHYMVDDIVASSLEEAGRGYARSITVALNADGSLLIADDGRGLPPVLDVALKTPWFPDPRAGVLGSVPPERDVFAIAVATSLSEWLRLQTKFEGRSFSQEYRTGLPMGQPLDLGNSGDAGISLTFMPDREIFSDTRLCAALLRDRLQECAMLHSGVGISFADEAAGANELFDFNDGIRVLVEELNRGRMPLHDVALIRGEQCGLEFEVGVQFCRERRDIVRAFVNDRRCDVGTHVTGLRVALTQSLKRFARRNDQFSDGSFPWSSTNKGLTAVISIRMEQPEFLGASRDKLRSPRARQVLTSDVGKRMEEYFIAHPDAATSIIKAGLSE